MTKNHGRPKQKRKINMKSSNRSNGKKVKLNLKDRSVKSSRLSSNITQWYLLSAFLFPWLSWLFEHGRDGLTYNHNEMFLADVS
jgi:hypothetical protein